MKFNVLTKIIKTTGWLGCLLFSFASVSATQNIPLNTQSAPLLRTDRIIIKLRPAVHQNTSNTPIKPQPVLSDEKLHSLNLLGRTTFTRNRTMTDGKIVLNLPHKMPLTEVRTIAKRLLNDPDIEYAEPDQMMTPLVTPPIYSRQALPAKQ